MNALLPAAACAVLAVIALAWALMERRRAAAAELRAYDLSERAANAEARARFLEEQGGAQLEVLRAQAAQSANAVAEELLKRSAELDKNREQLTQAKLEAQLKPVAETLAKFQEQVTAVEKTRAEETGGLKQQIAQLLAASTATQDEARKLSAALRRGAGVQGRWGEQTLRNVLEAAGLSNRYDFQEQTSTDTEEGRRRPDVTVKLPGGGLFVIDAKCSLTAFLETQEATEDAARDLALARHAQSVRGHFQQLSAKAYWDQFAASPDFVVMFVPGDSILAAALERAPELMTEAMDRKVILATPSTLFALCKAVVYGWRVEDQAANARHIADLGRELYRRIATMGSHAAAVGKSLEGAVKHYNQFVGSLETQVLTQARRFEDLKVDHQVKEIPDLSAIETGLRPLAKLTSADTPQIRVVGGDEA